MSPNSSNSIRRRHKGSQQSFKGETVTPRTAPYPIAPCKKGQIVKFLQIWFILV
jgi:hypothetical protein